MFSELLPLQTPVSRKSPLSLDVTSLANLNKAGDQQKDVKTTEVFNTTRRYDMLPWVKLWAITGAEPQERIGIIYNHEEGDRISYRILHGRITFVDVLNNTIDFSLPELDLSVPEIRDRFIQFFEQNGCLELTFNEGIPVLTLDAEVTLPYCANHQNGTTPAERSPVIDTDFLATVKEKHDTQQLTDKMRRVILSILARKTKITDIWIDFLKAQLDLDKKANAFRQKQEHFKQAASFELSLEEQLEYLAKRYSPFFAEMSSDVMPPEASV